MAGDNKRKRLDEDPEPVAEVVSNGFGVAETLSRLQGVCPTESVDAKSPEDAQRHKSKKKRVDGAKTKYPDITYADGKMQSSIRIADLQGLVLYCFADGIAPQWISVKHSGHMRKAVVLMVPGLEIGMFDGTIPLVPLETIEEQTTDKFEEADQSPEDSNTTDFQRWKQGLPPPDRSHIFNPRPLSSESLPAPLRPLAEMFPHVWPVKAPGDSKYNKVHSPLQAILLSSLPRSKDGDSKHKGPRAAKVEKGFVVKRTPITTFIHSVLELEESEYPLHPAFFTTDQEKASHTETRRRNGQTAENGWVDTNVPSLEAGDVPDAEIEKGSMTAGKDVLAIDCEMVKTEGDNFELARISIVNWGGEVVLDELVKPSRAVVDYLTMFSGMTEERLRNVTTTIGDIQKRLKELITPRTVLIGHSLNSDLTALRLTHPFIVDTTIIYPHPRGPPLKCGLKWLSQKYLGREIQKGTGGHSSIEDARAVLDLVKLKCEKGERWGTSDASNESIFRRLGRSVKPGRNPGEGRTGAVVDWGNPERGYGSQATVAIGCRDDEDVVKGVSAAINGDESNASIPGGGVDFVWARLRNLELLRGWCTRVPDAANANESTTVPQVESSNDSNTTLEGLKEAVTRTVSDISRIYESLPPCTMFIVYSGTGDPREVTRLQAMHKTYREEFNSRKPWDELTVKWTDTEEQALKKACERAREGCGFMCVK
ncbi:hypothetical protein PENDEC_c024G03254 [Penicillium decumbens]|uniref:Exonuclease domain-containing protein n=1 Tax=Penicillium decumbens TaxID=69771 RepID=A0A1V6P072_PENDC|nr:hypothetical protein PENDEC_c024G03254 [Penicillium decumbens]